MGEGAWGGGWGGREGGCGVKVYSERVGGTGNRRAEFRIDHHARTKTELDCVDCLEGVVALLGRTITQSSVALSYSAVAVVVAVMSWSNVRRARLSQWEVERLCRRFLRCALLEVLGAV